MRKARTIIHVNQHNIKANAKGESKPVLTCKTYKGNKYSNEVVILGQDGKEAAKIIYSPDKPLSCGAKVWIETYTEVQIKDPIDVKEATKTICKI
jgi:uncharacterized protein YabE (DUF348 family)